MATGPGRSAGRAPIAGHSRVPVVGVSSPAMQVRQRALARSGRPDEGDAVAGADLERDAVDGDDRLRAGVERPGETAGPHDRKRSCGRCRVRGWSGAIGRDHALIPPPDRRRAERSDRRWPRATGRAWRRSRPHRRARLDAAARRRRREVSSSTSPVGSSASTTRRIVGEGDGEAGSGRLAARQGRGRRRRAVGQSDGIEQFERCGRDRRGRRAAAPARTLPATVRCSKRLPVWNSTPIIRARRAARARSGRRVIGSPAMRTLAAVGVVEAGEAGEQRRLPRSRRPDHGDDLAAVDPQRHAAQGERLVVAGVEEAVEVHRVDRSGRGSGHGHVSESRDVSPRVDVVGTLGTGEREDRHRWVVEELVALDRQGRLAPGHRVRRAADLVGRQDAIAGLAA